MIKEASFRPECAPNQFVIELGTLFHVLTFGVRGSHVRDLALFWDYPLPKTLILRPEFRIPVAAQIGLSRNKYIVHHTKAQTA